MKSSRRVRAYYELPLDPIIAPVLGRVVAYGAVALFSGALPVRPPRTALSSLANTGGAEGPETLTGLASSALSRKPEDYYHGDRSAFLDWIGGRHERVLEIGCGAGGNAAWLRAHGARLLVGVEPDAAAAERARGVFDLVHAEAFETAIHRLQGPFDLIVCADVLEHMIDPWWAVRELRRLSAADGYLAVSIPNIRHFRALLKIAFGSGFLYETDGTFDSTHLRFFARANVEAMLRDGGWSPIKWGGSRTDRLRRAQALLARFTSGRLYEWLMIQWYVLAQPLQESRSSDDGA